MLIASTVLAAIPSFVAAIILISVFSVRLGWFPTSGAGEGLGDRIYHLFLPSIALSLTFIALVSRVTRSSMLDELRREHVEVAISRGMSKRSVVRRHVLRNALGPILTITGLLVAGLMVASAVVETAFSLNGMGSLLVQSVDKQDFAIVQAIVLLVVFAFVVVNTIVDIAYPFIDPRVDGRECGPMSILVGVEPRAGRMSRLRSFGGSWLFVLSCAVLVGFVLLAVFAPLLAPYPPDATDLLNSLAPPSAEHWLGTNQVGQDTLVPDHLRIADQPDRAAARSSSCRRSSASLLGLLAGWRGGWVDAVLAGSSTSCSRSRVCCWRSWRWPCSARGCWRR